MRKQIGATVAALVAVAALAATADAKDGDVEVTGTCTGPTTSELKLSGENGAIEVELEVDQNRTGVRWGVQLYRNGVLVGQRVKVTHGPSGSFEARFVTRNGPGADRLVARAARVGERCVARASFA